MLGDGTLESVVDRHYPLEAMAQAHTYVEGGHKQGHVVIDVAGQQG
jgi:NADPH:quinone reductase-like Zn-dependent oxidoreductase